MAGIGVRRIMRKALTYGKPGKSGPWHVSISTSPAGGPVRIGTLHHYGTAMLEWEWFPGGTAKAVIRGTWTGWGSVSDQTGVNAALSELESPLRYSRDTRGGGPRINPHRRRRRRR